MHTVLAEGTSADRQLAVYRETGDLKAVVQHLVQETRAGMERPGVLTAAELVKERAESA